MRDEHVHLIGIGDGRAGDELVTLPDEVLTLQAARNARAKNKKPNHPTRHRHRIHRPTPARGATPLRKNPANRRKPSTSKRIRRTIPAMKTPLNDRWDRNAQAAPKPRYRERATTTCAIPRNTTKPRRQPITMANRNHTATARVERVPETN